MHRQSPFESGYAMDNEFVQNHWGYISTAPAHADMIIIVRAVALDRLGGVGIQTESITA
jgi:hypothetical protein